jgi:Asp/Glu/hydantoin racemase
LPDFIDAAKDLVRLGAEAITTNCGFLSLFQKEIAAAVGVPVATSSLMQVPWVQATLPPGKRVGLVTVSGSTLTPAHLEGAGVPLDTPLVGTENGREFFRVLIKAEKEDMDVALAEQDVVEAGKQLVAGHPEIGAIVLECTNMPPYAAALQAAVGIPVYDIYSMITWFHAGLRPRAFS